MKKERKEGSALIAGVVGTSISPFASDGLDEALGLAVGLRTIRSGEAMLESELLAGGGEKFGAISGAAVGEHALDLNAVSFVEVDGVLESGQDTGSFLVREERGESEAGVIIDGDVQGFDASARVEQAKGSGEKS